MLHQPRLASVAAALGFVAWSSPVLAGWEYAQWGLSEAQLAAASGDRLLPCNATIQACTVRLPGYRPSHFVSGLTIAGLDADASFDFASGKGLVRTVIIFGGDGRNVRRLENAFTKTYGPPLEIKKTWMPHVLWRDVAQANSIRLIDLSPSYTLIEYTPAH
jgi:hypothetical protein